MAATTASNQRDLSVKDCRKPRIELSLKRSLCCSNVKLAELSFQPSSGAATSKCLAEAVLISRDMCVHFCLQFGVILKHIEGEST